MQIFFFTAFMAVLPMLVQAQPASSPNPTVTIASGVVVGTASRVSNQPSVTRLANAYLGVPFASSPPLRFAPPEPPLPYQTLTAQTLPPACLQQFFAGDIGDRERAYFDNPGLPPPPESEDCLYLNIYTPQDASPSNLKSVLFWIYGGNLQFGTASVAYYNGSSLAVNEDVVVVAVNYRTNIFGFSNSPEIATGQQNSGFLDQRFALQWVQDNIKQFGGDPSKVTIFGESAGGFSVKQILAQPPSPLPFRAAILESQNAVVVGDPTISYAQVALHFNCTTAVSTLTCLRQVPGADILAYISENNLAFGPVEDQTNMNANTLPSILSGQFARVPILIGTNSDEFSVFASMFGLSPSNLPNLTALASDFGRDISPILPSLLKLYGNGSTLAYEAVVKVVTDLLFTCTTQTFSSAVALAGRQPVYRYFYEGAFPDTTFFPDAGAFHSSEIPEVWGTYPLANEYGVVTPDQIALSAVMQGIWAGFANDPTASPGWPKLGSTLSGLELGVLGGAANSRGETTASLLHADLACPVLDPVNIAAGKAY